jgi:acetamidase/formamidase
MRLEWHISAHHRQSREASAGPCGLEIETAGDAIDIEALARKVQAGDDAAFHPAEIDFPKPHPATGDEFVLVRGFAFDLKPAIRELLY